MIKSLESQKVKVLNIFLLTLCIILFIASLFLLPFTVEGDNPKPWPIGLWCFLLGWLTIAKAGGLSWLANPLLIISWLMFKRNIKVAIGLSFAAIIFCSSFLFFDEVVTNEAGLPRRISSVGIGYYLWLTSSIITFASTLILFVFLKKPPFTHPYKLDT